MVKDTAPPHRYGPGFEETIRTQRATRHDDSIKRMLLDKVRGPRIIGMDETVDISSGKERFQIIPKHDARPLIDKVHEATFHDPIGLQWIKDNKYALRGLLRKAHCFTIDDATSSMIADFSVAIGKDLDSARRLALPPFPVTWIDHCNTKRIARIREMGLPLTPSASGEIAGPVVDRVGWLIHPADIGGHYMTYFCEVDQGVMMAPLSFWWHNGQARPLQEMDRDSDMDKFLHAITLGVKGSNCDVLDAYPCPTPLHIPMKQRYSSDIRDMMQEIAGELRHVWGLLIAIGSAQFGSEPHTVAQPLHNDIRKMPNGKPLLPLEHKILHLHLRRKTTPDKVVLRAITHHKHRWHEVRSHIRTLRNPDGSTRKLVPIPAHERGDKRLGRVEKTYKVEK